MLEFGLEAMTGTHDYQQFLINQIDRGLILIYIM